MKALLVWYPRCSTCINAKNTLLKLGYQLEYQDIKNDIPTSQQLDNWIKLSGLDIDNFFNKSGLVYKELNLKDKLSSLTYQEKLSLLSSNGMLIKRPILVCDNQVVVGKKEKQYEELIQKSVSKY